MRFRKTIGTALLLPGLLVAGLVSAQDGTRHFFHDLGYGSELSITPFSIVVNDAYDVLQLDNWDRRFGEHGYGSGWRALKRSLAHPLRAISEYGVGRFIRSELLPLSTRASGGGQWVPNYQLHLVGGGMLHTMLTEWYEVQGAPHPKVWALGTAIVERLINESIEHRGLQGYSGDAVADVYVFDLGGVLLFSSERVRRFFSSTLNMRAWPLQPAIGLAEGTLENVGSYFSLKWRLPRSEKWHLFYYFGMNNMLGVSYRRRDGISVSASGGLHAKRLVTVDEAGNRRTAELAPTAGLFVDRNGSLLGSLVFSAAHDSRWSLNVYPGILPGGRLSPGVWVQMGREGRVRFGTGMRWVPGLGIGSR